MAVPNGKLNISFSIANGSSEIPVSIIGMNGRVLARGVAISGTSGIFSASLELSNLATSICVVQIETDQSMFTTKLMLK